MNADKTEDAADDALEVRREAGVHGCQWGGLYGGYFSDPEVAAPFLEEVGAALARQPAEVVVDLGGGTGFVLGELARRVELAPGVRLIDLDLSPAQLAEIRDPRIEACQGSIMRVTREMLRAEDRRVLWFTRSTLHYFGLFGLKPLLRHLRMQMRPGEFFVHQSICCRDPEEALLLSEFMERLGTRKWVIPVEPFAAGLAECGWEVLRRRDAAPLDMDQAIAARRYHSTQKDIEEIFRILRLGYPKSELLLRSAAGWVLRAPYEIFVCRAV